MERWKKVKAYPEYEVSDLGNIRAVDQRKVRVYNHAYRTLYVGGGVKVKVANLVVAAFRKIPKKYKDPVTKKLLDQNINSNKIFANHIDGNKQNDCLGNLEWVNQKDNAIHAVRTGLRSKKRAGYIPENRVIKHLFKKKSHTAKDRQIRVREFQTLLYFIKAVA